MLLSVKRGATVVLVDNSLCSVCSIRDGLKSPRLGFLSFIDGGHV